MQLKQVGFAEDRPFAALDTTALSTIRDVSPATVSQAFRREGLALGVPMLAFGEALCTEQKARPRIDAMFELLVELGDRVIWLLDIREAVALDTREPEAERIALDAGRFWMELLNDVRGNGVTNQVFEGVRDWLAKDVSRAMDLAARESIVLANRGPLCVSVRDAFVDEMSTRVDSECAWIVELLYDHERRQSVDPALVLRSRYARAFAAWARIQMLASVSESGGKHSGFYQGLGRNRNGWVDARIGASSIEAHTFLSGDAHQRRVFSTISERLFHRNPLVLDLESWVNRTIRR